jgi:hypothetical protein
MYLGISIENFVTIGLMLLVWMIALHVIAQIGIAVPSWLNLGGGS